MAKTNFTKVEEVLEEGLRKMSVHHLFEQADQTAAQRDTPGQDEERLNQKLVEALKRDIQSLDMKRHKLLYQGLGLKRQDIKQLVSSPSALSKEEWLKIKEIKAGIDKYRQDMLAQLPQESDHTLIEQQRRKHINKRFNVNDKWLPLH